MSIKYYLEWAWSTWFGIAQFMEYCPLWDAKLKELLDKYEDSAEVDKYTIRLGETEVWIANRFYYYGSAYCVPNIPQKSPSLKTMFRLAKLQDKLQDKLKDYNYIKELEKIV